MPLTFGSTFLCHSCRGTGYHYLQVRRYDRSARMAVLDWDKVSCATCRGTGTSQDPRFAIGRLRRLNLPARPR